MHKFSERLVNYGFYILLFTVPLVFYPRTSELFEFNKMITVYLLTVIITCGWIIKIILTKKFIFRRTMLDIPLAIFIVSQLLSTLISLDQHTSLLGFYSRFNGGLASTISYALLYWAYVSNMNKEKTLRSIYFLISAGIIVAVWGTLEHFGRSISCVFIPPNHSFDVSCWVQDVQNRVYATLGQPNWMAAWITSLIPITWYFALKQRSAEKPKKLSVGIVANPYFWTVLSGLFFSALLFTKSRSGILGFAASLILFWPLALASFQKFKKSSPLSLFFKRSALMFALMFVVALIIGTPWSANLTSLINNNEKGAQTAQENIYGTVLEHGGSDSGEIRKIVWRGAIDIWKAYPILGTGVETFAYSYYKFRPVEHNLVSEWDFLYNKAHNEYLNYMSTTGTLGILAYLTLIIFSIMQIVGVGFKDGKNSTGTLDHANNSYPDPSQKLNLNIFSFSLLSGYVSILVTNFFGFSVVPVALLFFIFPAFAVIFVSSGNGVEETLTEKISTPQVVSIVLVFIASFFAVFIIAKYWHADYLYATGKAYSEAGSFAKAREYLQSSIEKSAGEAVFWDEYAKNEGNIALALNEEAGNEDLAVQFAASADQASKNAIELSPANVNLKRTRTSLLSRLAAINPNYILQARGVLQDAVQLAPTEAKLIYNLGLINIRVGDTEPGIELIKQAVEIKPNYRDARFALALVFIDLDMNEKAKEQLAYILERINPADNAAKEELENLK